MKLNDILKPNVFSEISRDIAQVFFAAMVVGPLIESPTFYITGSGLFLSLSFWLVSLRVAQI
ncbi:hypothetical protein KGQ27_02145 [Patescibacteria group bacterium]|nr:hypothetical protein [Patescibacteria group bacterium]MDE1946281.1 hypothetical protein [Patescibacteria group bacterium]MDE2010733.1 hypothetical protein [Patescibacteria group bacterium]MDE2232617.1 hypothetical protein [Patescibacteria group bacterium]